MTFSLNEHYETNSYNFRGGRKKEKRFLKDRKRKKSFRGQKDKNKEH